jgi:hypothetical protein
VRRHRGSSREPASGVDVVAATPERRRELVSILERPFFPLGRPGIVLRSSNSVLRWANKAVEADLAELGGKNPPPGRPARASARVETLSGRKKRQLEGSGRARPRSGRGRPILGRYCPRRGRGFPYLGEGCALFGGGAPPNRGRGSPLSGKSSPKEGEEAPHFGREPPDLGRVGALFRGVGTPFWARSPQFGGGGSPGSPEVERRRSARTCLVSSPGHAVPRSSQRGYRPGDSGPLWDMYGLSTLA